MGGSASKSISDSAAFVSSVAMNSVMTNGTSCASTTTATQNQTVTIDGSGLQDLEKVCLQLGHSTADCAAMVAGGTTVDGISQAAILTVGQNCTVDDTNIASIQQDITNQIMQKINSSSDDVGDALKAIATAAGGKNQSNIQLSTTISSLVSDSFTVSNTRTMVQTVIAGQNQVISILNAPSAAIKNVQQSIQIQALSTLVANSTNLNNAVQQVQNSVTQSATQSSEALPGLWSTLQGFFTGLFGTMTNAYIASGISVACVVLCCCVVCIAFFATGGQSTLQQGISTAGSLAPLAALA